MLITVMMKLLHVIVVPLSIVTQMIAYYDDIFGCMYLLYSYFGRNLNRQVLLSLPLNADIEETSEET